MGTRKVRKRQPEALVEPKVEAGTALLADLKPATYNPRTIDKGARRTLGRSIKRFGLVEPIVVNRRNMVIVGGHQRFEQLQEMGRAETAVMWVELDETDEKALNVLLNSRHAQGEWDHDALADILHDLQAVPDFPMADFSFDALLDDIAKASPPMEGIGGDDEDDEDDTPDLRPEVRSKRGEVYELGPHRLLCGDCRDMADLLTLFDGERVTVAVTSPPYASQREYDESSGFKPIPPGEFVEWFDAVQAGVRSVLADDGSWFVNIKPHAEDGQRSLYVLDLVAAHVRRWAWRFVDEFAWVRSGVPGDWPERFKNGWEPVFHFAGPARVKFRPHEVSHPTEQAFGSVSSRSAHFISGSEVEYAKGHARPTNVIEAAAVGSGRVGDHPAAFPVGLPAFFIRAFSDPGDVVFDPFMGSGTTLIAAAKFKRRAFGTEISPAYCDVIRRRWTKWARENEQAPGAGALD